MKKEDSIQHHSGRFENVLPWNKKNKKKKNRIKPLNFLIPNFSLITVVASFNSYYWLGWLLVSRVRRLQAIRFELSLTRSHLFFHRINPYIVCLYKSFLIVSVHVLIGPLGSPRFLTPSTTRFNKQRNTYQLDHLW